MSQTIADITRLIHNMLQLGTIAEVDHATARVRLMLSGRPTDWLPYPAEIGQNYRRWRPLRVGTQVLAACPSGNPANAVIIQVLYSDAIPSPSGDGALDLIAFDDGTTVKYDSTAHTLTVDGPENVVVNASVAATVTTGNATINATGDAEVTAVGEITANAGGAVTVMAATVVAIDAPTTNINSAAINCNGTTTVQALVLGAGGASGNGVFTGNMRIVGNLEVTQNIDANGTITDVGGNTANHSHPLP